MHRRCSAAAPAAAALKVDLVEAAHRRPRLELGVRAPVVADGVGAVEVEEDLYERRLVAIVDALCAEDGVVLQLGLIDAPREVGGDDGNIV